MEDELIARAQRGDEAAFQQLVETYTATAWRAARSLLRDRAAAEDAVQEAWLDAWRGLPRFQRGRPFRPWFLTLVTNRCRMSRRWRTPATVGLHALGNDLADEAVGRDGASDLPSDDELNAALAHLPAEQRQVLELRYFADLELSEIAAVTGAPGR